MSITATEIRDLDSTDFNSFEDSDIETYIDIAERQTDNLYGGRMSRVATRRGDKDDFVRFLTAHLLEKARGGDAQSESATGGSVNYNTVTGDPQSSLSETKWGRECLTYIRERQSVGIVRTWR